MGERYWISGVQLGLLQSFSAEAKRQKLINEILDKQFIGNYPTDGDKEAFAKAITHLDIEGKHSSDDAEELCKDLLQMIDYRKGYKDGIEQATNTYQAELAKEVALENKIFNHHKYEDEARTSERKEIGKKLEKIILFCVDREGYTLHDQVLELMLNLYPESNLSPKVSP